MFWSELAYFFYKFIWFFNIYKIALIKCRKKYFIKIFCIVIIKIQDKLLKYRNIYGKLYKILYLIMNNQIYLYTLLGVYI